MMRKALIVGIDYYEHGSPLYGCASDDLKDLIQTLFQDTIAHDVLFYFSGHGVLELAGGYILGSDSKRGDEGISMSDIIHYANSSPARNKIIILDCCHSGNLGVNK